jgi:1-deoxy-D-xylulose-5-phosphate reductoisomerase
LNFERPDFARFPNLRLAYEAVRAGGIMPAVLNAANEIAVTAFLEGRIRFTAIPGIIEHSMETIEPRPADSIEGILEADRESRLTANAYIKQQS